jgi:hypothetical protein
MDKVTNFDGAQLRMSKTSHVGSAFSRLLGQGSAPFFSDEPGIRWSIVKKTAGYAPVDKALKVNMMNTRIRPSKSESQSVYGMLHDVRQYYWLIACCLDKGMYERMIGERRVVQAARVGIAAGADGRWQVHDADDLFGKVGFRVGIVCWSSKCKLLLDSWPPDAVVPKNELDGDTLRSIAARMEKDDPDMLKRVLSVDSRRVGVLELTKTESAIIVASMFRRATEFIKEFVTTRFPATRKEHEAVKFMKSKGSFFLRSRPGIRRDHRKRIRGRKP